MAGATYVWATNGSGAWGDPNNWEETDPNPAFPAGPPTAGDEAAVAIPNATITLTGPGTASTITLGTVDLSGDFSADTFAAQDVTLTAGSMSAAKQLVVDFGGTLSVQSGTVTGPATPPDATTEQFDNFGVVDLAFGTTLNSYEFLDDGTLQADGRVAVTFMAVGSFSDAVSSTSEAGSLDVTGSGTVADILGIVGTGTDDGSSATVTGGEWDNQQLIIASTIAAEAIVASNGTITATGGFNIAPEATEALAIGSAIDAGSGAVSATGTLTVTGVGSRAAVTGDVSVGHGGVGSLTLESGGVLGASGALIAATDVGSGADTATILVDTGGSLLQIANDATLGADGAAAVTINAGGSFTVGGTLDLGLNAGGIGALAVAGGLVTVVGDARIGDSGSGGLTLSAGGTFEVAGTLDEGTNAGATGTSLFNDPADTLALGSDWIIGDAGAHSDSINADMRITVPGALTLGAQTGGAGTLDVSTPSASVTVDKDITIGLGGSAALLVQDAAQVAGAQVIVGDQENADGTITVSGTSEGIASALSFGTSLVIGGSGTGTLLVAGGANVGPATANTGALEIGAQIGGRGLVTVTGTGSALSASEIDIGGSGTAAGGVGALDIETRATVDADLVTLFPTGTIELQGGNLLTDPITVAGQVSGFGQIAGAMTNTGAIIALGGSLTLTGAVDGSGVLGVETGATLELQSGIAAGQTIEFAGGTVQLDDTAATAGTFANFVTGDTIVLQGVTADGGSFAGGTLTLTEGTATVGSLAFSGTFNTGDFSIATVGAATVITRASVACFAAGTRIAAEHGEVAVEQLRVGDRVHARFGGLVPVVWIGHRQVDCRHHPEPDSVWPVLVRAGAFGATLPRRDLHLSPDHAVYVDGVLVPIRCLINDQTIVQQRRGSVSYWHIELPTHDVLLAERLPSESFLDTGNRSAFSNGGAAVMLHPVFTSLAWEASGCAELVVHGPRLAAIRQRLAARQTRTIARRHLYYHPWKSSQPATNIP